MKLSHSERLDKERSALGIYFFLSDLLRVSNLNVWDKDQVQNVTRKTQDLFSGLEPS